MLTGWLLWGYMLHVATCMPLDPEAACPFDTRKLTVEEIRNGSKPYILGGHPQPSCVNCETDLYTKFCAFRESENLNRVDICTEERQQRLLGHYLEQGGMWGEYLTFSPCEMWPFIRGRTTFVIGDSQAAKFFDSLQCFFFDYIQNPVVFEAEPPLQGDDEDTKKLLEELVDPSGETTPLMCRRLLDGSTRICYLRAVKVRFLKETMLPMLRRLAQPDDIVVMNVGVWHNLPEVYEQGMQLLNEFIAKYRRCLPYLIWMDSSVQHFDTPHGGWDEFTDKPTHKECKSIRDIAFDTGSHTLVADDPDHIVLHGGWRNKVARATMRQLGIPVVETWNHTLDLYDYHVKIPIPDHHDCTHFCHPSSQQVWLWDLYRTLAHNAAGLQQHIALSVPMAVPDSVGDLGSGAEANAPVGAAADPQEDGLCQEMEKLWVPGSQQKPSVAGYDKDEMDEHGSTAHRRLLRQFLLRLGFGR